MNALRRELRVLNYQRTVRALAHRLKFRLPPSIELDDCIQVGMLAVWTAPDHMPGPWMRQRIWWAMIDAIKGKEYREATRASLSAVEDGPLNPVPEPVDHRLNVEQLMVERDEARLVTDAASAESARLHSAIADADPLNHRLTIRERRVLGLRYTNRGMTQMRIARNMKISQVRVSQLQTAAIGRLQQKLAA